MTKRSILIPALMLTCFSYAQKSNLKFKLGDEYHLPKKTEDIGFTGNDKFGMVNLSVNDDKLFINRFDIATLSNISTQELKMNTSSRINSETLVDFGSGFCYWIYSDWDKKNDKELLFYDKIDIAKGQMAEADHKINETTRIANKESVLFLTNYKKEQYHESFKYNYTYDKAHTKLLISYRLIPESKRDKKNFDKLGMIVLDQNMNVLWSNEYKMPYTEAMMDNSDFSVDSKGNAYMLCKVRDDKGFTHEEMFKFSKDSKDIAISQIPTAGTFINSSTVTSGPNNEMLLVCTYTKPTNGSASTGVFIATMDETGKMINYKKGFYEFPKSELMKFSSGKELRKMEKNDDTRLNDLVIRDIKIQDDGSIFVAGERNHMVISQETSSASSRPVYTSYYEDLIACQIDASGKFAWLRKIPKRQQGGLYKGTMSYKLICDATGYYFLYLDNLKNLNLPPDETPYYHRDGLGGQVIVSKISNSGVVSKQLLFDTREEDVMIYPSEFMQVKSSQFVGRARVKGTLFKPIVIDVQE